ncbi:shikimate dehydrogenase family protein [Qipengyuania sp.]|uniref:shikimate dehydrogenase family protein n=1 Tax=Qipengyuania sp. TaxID=2004515 RepID=UPI0035C7C24C
MSAYAEVIGDPIVQSKSPVIHGFWLEQLSIPARYDAVRVSEGDVASYFADRRADPDWRGCNVTMPLKRAVMSELDELDPKARAIGAVNTIFRSPDGALTGTNTDGDGFCEPLGPILEQSHLFRMARVLGTGGAARAIVWALARRGFTIVLAGRDLAKARSLLTELAPEGEHHAIELQHFAEPTDFAFDDRQGCCDLVVNASALGMRGQAPLRFDWSHAPPGSIAYDIVTDPVRTAFLRSASAQGFATVDGLSMLIGQAALAFEKFFGSPPPRENDASLRKLLTG